MDSTAIVRLLTSHWLQGITCRHNEQTDQALCYCGWRGPECANVREAVKSWAEHVTEPLRSVEVHKPKPNWLHDIDEKAGII